MKQWTKVVLVAGAALSTTALAQNAKLDLDRTYAAEVKADAASRSSLLAQGGMAGYGPRGFTLTDGDGSNTLTIGGLIHSRFYYGTRDDVPDGDGGFINNADSAMGFQNNNTRFWMTGNVYDSNLAYKLQALVDFDGTFMLEEAWGRWGFDNGVSLTFGQLKLPLLREENINSDSQLAVDRSQMNQYFTQGVSQGVQLSWNNEQWRFMGGVSDGTGTANTSWVSPLEYDFGINGRVDFMWAGNNWDQFNQFSSWRSNDTYAGMVGGAVIYQDGGGSFNTIEATLFGYTLDVTIQGQGWSGYAAVVGTNFDPDGGTSISELGFLLQGSYFFDNQFEVFGRWDAISLDSDTVGPNQDDFLSFLTFGVNYYISPESQAAKFTGDIVVSLNETTALVDPELGDPQTGLLGSTDGGEVDLRLQLQLRF